MLIGIPPFYIFPGSIEEWGENSTHYAANMGAMLISQALIRQLSAEYVDITKIDINDSNLISSYRMRFDVCILALATHIHPHRDVSQYASFLENLKIKTIVLSAGISDYDQEAWGNYQIHSSMKRILDIASDTSEWIGVRGHYTASVLRKHGYTNVVPIGCPTMFWPLTDKIKINKGNMENPLIAYHRLLAINNPDIIRGLPLLGQDWQDQPVFTDTLSNQTKLLNYIDDEYNENGEDIKADVFELIRNNGKFFFAFDEWFDCVAKHDFVLGGRLHGTIAALIQNIPAVLVVRDLRTKEMAEFFDIPSIGLSDLSNHSLRDIFEDANYSKFHSTYLIRRSNFVNFLRENNLVHNFNDKDLFNGFRFNYSDLNVNMNLAYAEISTLFSDVSVLKQNLSNKSVAEIENMKRDLLDLNIVLRVVRRLRKLLRR